MCYLFGVGWFTATSGLVEALSVMLATIRLLLDSQKLAVFRG